MDDHEALIQIVHISDLHFQAENESYQGACERTSLRAWGDHFERIGWPKWAAWCKDARENIGSGEPEFIDEFERSLDKLMTPVWKDKTWLVQTGDLTAMGGHVSVREMNKRLGSICTSRNVRMFSMYGNHDAWPRAFPAMAALARPFIVWRSLSTHDQLTWLRESGCFHDTYPVNPAFVTAKDERTHLLELHLVDTITNHPILNTFGFGLTGTFGDYARGRPGVQLKQLVKRLDEPSGGRCVSVIACHHPVHDNCPEVNRYQMRLLDAQVVADSLAGTTHAREGHPTIVLCGHYHACHPLSVSSTGCRRFLAMRPWRSAPDRGRLRRTT
ncbi:MAG: metallophosphoesterase [Candidatus Riflebacteria bacterium]|nr:metallophosphoesterase [Candidatus Riflebacteria bacterium]